MRTKIFFLALFASFLFSKILLAGSDDQFFQYLSTNTVAASGEVSLLRPTGLTAKSVNPTKIVFNWFDNSTNEEGYKFQREKVGIYWDFGCEAGANANYKEHNISSNPELYERFRLFAYSGSSRSDYEYVGVQMLRPDIYIPDNHIRFSTSNIYPGCKLSATTFIANGGTFAVNYPIVKCYFSQFVDFGSPENLNVYLGEQILTHNGGPMIIRGSCDEFHLNITIPAKAKVGIPACISFTANEDRTYLELDYSNNSGKQMIDIGSPARINSNSDSYNLDIESSSTTKSGSLIYVDKDISSDKVSNMSMIEIFPNPSKGNIKLSNTSAYEMVKIFDIEGKIVYELNIQNEQNDYSIDLTNNKPGIYFIKAIGKASVDSKKFIIE